MIKTKIILLTLFSIVSYGQTHILNYNHLYEDIQFMKTAGGLTSLDLSTTPLDWCKLYNIFENDTNYKNIRADNISSIIKKRFIDKTLARFSAGLKISNNIEDKYSLFNFLDILGNGLYTNLFFHNMYITVSNNMFFTTSKNQAVRDKPHAVKELYAYTNTAYIKGSFKISNINTTLLAGRDYYKIGFARDASLFLSDFSRPFDQFRMSLKYKALSMDLLTIQLENISEERRLLFIHRLGINFGDKLYLSFSEGALNSGVNRPIEFQYLNPFMFWLPDKTSGTTSRVSNTMLHFSFSFYPIDEWNIWGEILVDDYQINSEKQTDLEPNEFGYIIGFEKVKYPFNTSDLWLQYSAVTNRTYQTPMPTEIYTHKSFPIGHYLGNDFDMFQFHYSQENEYRKQRFKPYFDVAYIRDGANGLDTPFDTPWMDSTVTMEAGYSEPFPTGPVTYVTEIETGFGFHFKNGSYVNTGLAWQRKGFQGKVENDYSLVIRLSLILSKKYNY